MQGGPGVAVSTSAATVMGCHVNKRLFLTPWRLRDPRSRCGQTWGGGSETPSSLGPHVAEISSLTSPYKGTNPIRRAPPL